MPDLVVDLPSVPVAPLQLHGVDLSVGVPFSGTRLRPGPALGRRVWFLIGVVVIGALIIELHDPLLAGSRCLLSLDPSASVAIAACLLILLVTRAAVNRLALRNSTMTQGLMLDQISLAASNGLPGGVVLGPAARYRVSRTFGHSAESSALATFAAGQAFSLGRWFLVLIVLGHQILVGGTSTADAMVMVSAILAFLIAGGVWIVLRQDSGLARSAVVIGQRGLDRIGLRWRRFRNCDVAAMADAVREAASWMAPRRALALLVAGAMSTAASGSIIIIVVMTTSRSTADLPGAWTILEVYLLARVTTSFIPTPGALAALDAALIGGLLATGVDPQVATASVLIYRAVTFVLPILMGGAIYLGWRRRSCAAGGPVQIER